MRIHSGHRPARSFAVASVALVAGALLAGCNDGGGADSQASDDAEYGEIVTAAPEAPDSEEGFRQPAPTEDADCPYLSAEEAAELTGEIVDKTQIDPAYDPPACFFGTQDGAVSLMVSVETVESEDEAVRLVDEVVPPDSTERADVEGGWTGGKNASEAGATLAVYREDQVFTVQATQGRSEAVQSVADTVIPRL